MAEISVRYEKLSQTLRLIPWIMGGQVFYSFVPDIIEDRWLYWHPTLYLLAWAIPGTLVAIFSSTISSTRQVPERSSICSILMLLIPFAFLLLAGFLYLHLNRHVLVQHLGCGCRKGFNTNDLTSLSGVALSIMALIACVASSRSLAKTWRAAYFFCSGVFLSCSFDLFLKANIWL